MERGERGYLLTGDPSFLPWAERWKQDFVRCVREGDDPFWYGDPKDQWYYSYLTLHLLYMPYYLEAVSTLEKPVNQWNTACSMPAPLTKSKQSFQA